MDDALLEVEVSGYKLNGDDPKTQYHTYVVTVSRGMDEVKTLEKRFSEFEALRTQLMADDKHREIVQTIDFPPQRWFGKLKQSTVDERVAGLGSWLSKIIAAPKVLGSPILEQFLGGTGPTAGGGAAQ